MASPYGCGESSEKCCLHGVIEKCKCRRKSAVICRGSAISLFRASPYSFWNFPWGLHECATLALRLRKTR